MRPILSIGIIFRNEIRCLERCVKSLAKLRETLPCELVMADTGSDDGSREVAEKYADILFEFPWINDFSAARNAVMDRCSGEWYFSVDADEWLDGDLTELTGFLSDRGRWKYPCGGVIVRNYHTADLDGEYSDFVGTRLCRMSANMRFSGAIHERWDYAGCIIGLGSTILHHDGYVALTEDHNRKKRERNLPLLREKLARNPENAEILLQYIEGARGDPSYEKWVRAAVAVIEKKCPKWEHFGPPVFRYAVQLAAIGGLPELEDWAAEARELFPKSPYTAVDVVYLMFMHYAEQADVSRAIPLGEEYLKNLADFQAGRFALEALMVSTVVMATPHREDRARAVLADLYFQTGQTRKAGDMLLSIDRSRMKPEAVRNYMRVLLNLQAQGDENLSWVMTEIWERINGVGTKDLRNAVIREAAIAFSPENRRSEDEKGYTHAYRIFLPLSGKCGLGTAAEILESNDAARMEELLAGVDNWEELPIVALERALLSGAALPAGLRLEEMDTLAERLSRTGSGFSRLLDDARRSMDRDLPSLMWARGMALAAVSVENWKDGESGSRTARVFADVERAFLSRYYAADFLTDEKIQFLPPMHRFGWYCAQAFDALDAGDRIGCIHCLSAGLASSAQMQPMVEYLLEHTPQLQVPKPSSELLELAEKVRAVLSAYPPDDPAVLALQQSPAYQRVAHLIEGPDIGLYGGLTQ